MADSYHRSLWPMIRVITSGSGLSSGQYGYRRSRRHMSSGHTCGSEYDAQRLRKTSGLQVSSACMTCPLKSFSEYISSTPPRKGVSLKNTI
ncbi:hypothetical protein RCIA63 [Methanocella arvoryzae MRE50]|uniref:Uncharacterized protein n=1 Tax=Methanocella arvoryzae (strain DSM 22066 / NBRC 105507 / MRE50) TaxID=351160 RepID=Q0W593_METAR|nr:hypothetical protein RCIA63 [Methanocella arvoryzae MRE50]